MSSRILKKRPIPRLPTQHNSMKEALQLGEILIEVDKIRLRKARHLPARLRVIDCQEGHVLVEIGWDRWWVDWTFDLDLKNLIILDESKAITDKLKEDRWKLLAGIERKLHTLQNHSSYEESLWSKRWKTRVMPWPSTLY